MRPPNTHMYISHNIFTIIQIYIYILGLHLKIQTDYIEYYNSRLKALLPITQNNIFLSPRGMMISLLYKDCAAVSIIHIGISY